MTDFSDGWTNRFESGESIRFSPRQSDVSIELDVYSREDDCLYFLIPESAEALEAFRLENRVTLRASDGGIEGSGTIRIIDVEPSVYEKEAGHQVKFDASEFCLLRLDATELHREGGRIYRAGPKGPSGFVAWLKACRFYSLSASLVPMLLGIVYAVRMNWTIGIDAGLLALGGGVFLHLATNLHNDVSDHLRGIDQYGDYGGAGVIQKGWLSARTVWKGSLILYGLGVLSGLPLVWIRGEELLVVGALGLLGASTYSLRNYGSKYSGLGDLSVFVLMGPLMAVGTSIAASGVWSWDLVFASVPVGFFVVLILHANNLHDIPIDRRAGATTLASVLGFRASRVYYGCLLLVGYASTGLLVLLGVAPATTLLIAFTLPLALGQLRVIRKADGPLESDLGELRFKAARLHLLFGSLYLVGFAVPSFLP